MNDDALRRHLLNLLQGKGAHLDYDAALAAFPPALAGAALPDMPHTPWRLLEHLRIAQWDILEFSRDPDHVSPDFPDGYWPATSTPPDAGAWEQSVAAFRRDLAAMQALVADPATDLFAAIPHGDGQTVLREVLILSDHNAYHLGQLLLIQRTIERRDQTGAAGP
jgi:hypothetical protein